MSMPHGKSLKRRTLKTKTRNAAASGWSWKPGPNFCPDELKIYPCSLIASAELMQRYQDGSWQPYTHDELLSVLIEAFRATPEYCRLTRVIRDIPGTDIVVGNKVTNLRQVVE